MTLHIVGILTDSLAATVRPSTIVIVQALVPVRTSHVTTGLIFLSILWRKREQVKGGKNNYGERKEEI